ncbi:hypothetical protein LTR85_005330 [Meristemomyces frigidus]|nr:hypothetical protein LTR85_005330 [Meristemomyces frigidus]
MAAANACPFLELPPELRTRIYELVLVSPDERLIMKDEPSPALLRTCRQIRTDASSLYYAQNTFLITNAESLCIAWLTSLPPKMRAHIRTLRMHTNCRLSDKPAADYKRELLSRLYSTIRQKGLGAGLTLEVFLELD